MTYGDTLSLQADVPGYGRQLKVLRGAMDPVIGVDIFESEDNKLTWKIKHETKTTKTARRSTAQTA